jgi:ribose/xylose/arabinose/galactoside ABC-type transport system permease subunit
MAYDDSRFRGEPGFREEPEFHRGGVPEDAPSVSSAQSSVYTPGNYPVGAVGPINDYSSPGHETTVGIARGRRASPSAAQLGEVFDDPDHGEPGRDRMGVHILWEVVLLLAAAALAYLLRDLDGNAFTGAGRNELALFAAEIGLLTVGVALSLRANSVNLAAGPTAYAAALFFAGHSGRGLLFTAGITLLLALGVAAVIAVLVAGFHVPSWAASLGTALALMAWIARQGAHKVAAGAYDPHTHALYWFGGVAGLSLLGGGLGLVKSIRRAVGRFRPVGDPARRRGGPGGVMSTLALAGSSVLAAGAGVLIALDQRDVTASDNGLALTGLALGAALLGGTSAFGRRGGVFGTVLAVVLLALLVRYSDAKHWNVSLLGVGAFAIFAGVVVTRLVETFGRPHSAGETPGEAEWQPSAHPEPLDLSDSTSWSPGSRTGGWTSQLPARTTDEGWGAEERWGTR